MIYVESSVSYFLRLSIKFVLNITRGIPLN